MEKELENLALPWIISMVEMLKLFHLRSLRLRRQIFSLNFSNFVAKSAFKARLNYIGMEQVGSGEI